LTPPGAEEAEEAEEAHKAQEADPEQVFAALADPTRRQLLELLGGSPGRSASALAGLVPVSRQAVAQHLAVLEDCRLVQRRRSGREVVFSVRPDRLAETARWLADRADAWRGRLELLKRQAEEASR
jgi:DNA-binding transcriptional ArsR family regulator